MQVVSAPISVDGVTIVESATHVLSVPNGGIGEAQLAADAVTSAKIADNAVGLPELSDGVNASWTPGYGDATTAVGAAVVYFGPGAPSATENQAQGVFPTLCRVRKVAFRVLTQALTTGTYTLRKNGVDTAVSINVAAGTAATTVVDVDDVDFASNDLWSVSVTRTGGVNSCFLLGFMFEVEPR